MNIQTSSHFDRVLIVLGLISAFFLLIYVVARKHITGKAHITPINRSFILKPQDKDMLHYNSSTHILTTITATKTTNQYVRNPTIELLKDGDVKIDAKSYGLEMMPFLGFGYSDILRIHAGVSLAYFQKLDLNMQLAFSQKIGVTVQPFTTISYTLYDNTSVFAGVNLIDVVLREPTEYTVGILVKL